MSQRLGNDLTDDETTAVIDTALLEKLLRNKRDPFQLSFFEIKPKTAGGITI